MTSSPKNKPIPDLTAVQIALCDLNGVARGKRIPGSQVEKALQGAMRMPLSVPTVDIWGRDIEECKMIFASGDGDGICQPVRDNLLSSPWLGSDAATLPVWMFKENGEPNEVDPRQALARITQRYTAKGLTPVVATELEFYLTPLNGPLNNKGREFTSENILSLQLLDEVAPLLDAIYAACAEQGIPADAAISECGPGQFEINLLHRNDALLAADDAVFFKRIVKGFARTHGYAANFMAKPDGTSAGSGMHLHFSLLDTQGHNVFDNGSEEGSDLLKSAVAGVLAAMAESTLIFAPHFNSYRRLRPNTHAPTSICWGYENRTAAVRIPGGSLAARRIEHRVAGADANPYLVMTAVLGAALAGIEKSMTPPAPVDGNGYETDAAQLPGEWATSIAAFESGSMIPELFSQQLRDVFIQLKRQELSGFLEQVSPFELSTYADLV